MNNSLKNQLIEGILFLKGKSGIKLVELLSIIKISEEELYIIIEQINAKYMKVNSPFIIKINGDKIRTSLNKETSELIAKKLNKPLKIKLSKALIEVLTIISYYQPITKSQINKIRKSNSDYILYKLEKLDLIEWKERASTPGNPRLWITTNVFLEAFDLEKIQDLPNYNDKKELEESLLREVGKIEEQELEAKSKKRQAKKDSFKKLEEQLNEKLNSAKDDEE